MTPAARKTLLTVHIACAAVWIGAVAAFLVISIAGLQGSAAFVPGAYVAMDLVSRYVVIPASLGATASGFAQAALGPWGVRRYYWVILKWVLAGAATLALIVHQLVAVRIAAAQATGGLTDDSAWRALQVELVRAPSIALAVLLSVLILAVAKPWGPTAYGRATQLTALKNGAPAAVRTPLGVRLVFLVLALAIIGFIALHLSGAGFHHHG